MEKGNTIKWILVLVAIVVVGFGAMKIFGSFTATGNAVQDTTTQITSTGEVKEFTMTAMQWQFSPDNIEVDKGDKVVLKIKSVDVTHGIAIPAFKVWETLEPGKEVRIEFIADKTGTFSFACSVPCGPGHTSMLGKIVVR
jgi:cytochrome c oxidase subunit 2